jgi:hypothetical protein
LLSNSSNCFATPMFSYPVRDYRAALATITSLAHWAHSGRTLISPQLG